MDMTASLSPGGCARVRAVVREVVDLLAVLGFEQTEYHLP
jgi:hypothetical protein